VRFVNEAHYRNHLCQPKQQAKYSCSAACRARWCVTVLVARAHLSCNTPPLAEIRLCGHLPSLELCADVPHLCADAPPICADVPHLFADAPPLCADARTASRSCLGSSCEQPLHRAPPSPRALGCGLG
jgi:hypothetical protein